MLLSGMFEHSEPRLYRRRRLHHRSESAALSEIEWPFKSLGRPVGAHCQTSKRLTGPSAAVRGRSGICFFLSVL